MPQIDRFSVSLDTELLAAFDRYIAVRGYDNRSEAVRDMIRDRLVEGHRAEGQTPVAGFLTLVCDLRVGEAARRLRACTVDAADLVRGALHVAVDAHHDAMALAFRGPADEVCALADRIQALRGVAHGRLSVLPLDRPAAGAAVPATPAQA